MIESIKINEFLGLNIELNNFGMINYLVGVNGCGKSRILNSISNKLGGSINNIPIAISYITFFPEIKGIAVNPVMGNGGGQPDNSLMMNETLQILKQQTLNKEKIKSKTEILHLTGEQNEIYTDQLTYNGKVVENIIFSQGTNYFHNLIQKIIKELAKRNDQLTETRGRYIAIIIEDIEKLLHPTAQKLLPTILLEKILSLNLSLKVQFFISTHSPFIIRGALNNPLNKVFHIKEKSIIYPIDYNSIKINNWRIFDDILNDLGFEMKDLYLSNKLIYVEGPVDILYINYWLNKYIEEQCHNFFFKGLDYDFVEYGGSLAAHLTINFNQDEIQEKILEQNKLVNIFSINRQIFFITDNDTNGNAFEKTKNRIKELITNINNGSIFYREQSITTIEDYLTVSSSLSTNKNNKIKAAITNLKYWQKNSIGLSDFKPELLTLVKELYKFLAN